jgi:purine-cytosine permease-like protein
VFVPLFGVFVADYFVHRRRGHTEEDLFEGNRRLPRLRAQAMVPWAIGFLVYQWSVPTALGWWTRWMHALFHGFLHLPFPLWNSVAGGSIPSFAVAFVLAIVLLRRRAGDEPRPTARAGEPGAAPPR